VLDRGTPGLDRTDGGGDVGRRWRLNPPPNWPVLPDGWEPAPDWSPDPAWGPAPVGWTLWRRERRGAWLRRHRRSAGIGSAAVLTLFVALAGPPSSGTFSDTAPGAVALGVPPPAGGTMIAPGTPPDREADPPIRLERRLPPASRERRATPRSHVVAAVPTAVRERDPDRRRTPNRTPHRAPSGGPAAGCPSSAPAPTTTPEVFGRPTATSGSAPVSATRPTPAAGTCSPGGGGGSGGAPAPTGSSSPEPSG